MTLTMDSLVVQSGDIVACELAGEMALLHFESGIYYGLDETGTSIWRLVQSPRSVREVWEAMLTVYNVDPNRCEEDVLALLQSMIDEHLVEVQPHG